MHIPHPHLTHRSDPDHARGSAHEHGLGHALDVTGDIYVQALGSFVSPPAPEPWERALADYDRLQQERSPQA